MPSGGAAGGRVDPAAPGVLRGPAHGQAAGRLQRRPAADARPLHRHVDLVDARAAGGPAALLPAGRRRLGRHALARHLDLPRPLVHRGRRSGRHVDADRQPERSRQAARPRARVLGHADDHDHDAGTAQGVRGGAAQAQDRRRQRRDRAAPADRLVPGPADCVDELLRLQRLRELPPRGGRRQRAARDRAGHADPGRHGHVAPELHLEVGRARARGLRRQRALERGARRRHRGRGRHRAGEPEGARLDLLERRHRRALGALPGRRSRVLLAAAHPRDRADPGHAVPRGRPAALASAGGRARDAARRGQGLGAAGGRLRQLGQVALHRAALLRGRPDRRAPADGVARAVPRQGRHAGQPGAGADARRDAASGDRDREGAGRDAAGRRPVHVRAARASRRIRSRRRCSRWRRTSAPRTRSRPTRG